MDAEATRAYVFNKLFNHNETNLDMNESVKKFAQDEWDRIENIYLPNKVSKKDPMSILEMQLRRGKKDSMAKRDEKTQLPTIMETLIELSDLPVPVTATGLSAFQEEPTERSLMNGKLLTHLSPYMKVLTKDESKEVLLIKLEDNELEYVNVLEEKHDIPPIESTNLKSDQMLLLHATHQYLRTSKIQISIS
eukprot:GHVH01000849.1.p1 GENE.GHVH01000849.1~~GHVH01000849.1.p1  ORF type:complete len:192 (+),score=36.40 GHVH01000849.1:86-661(+)